MRRSSSSSLFCCKNSAGQALSEAPAKNPVKLEDDEDDEEEDEEKEEEEKEEVGEVEKEEEGEE